MKFAIAIFILGVSCAHGLDLETEWENFKVKYEKDYLSAQEHDVRKLVFSDNLNFIQKHNEEEARGLHTYRVGVNKFADLTNKEFTAQYNGNLVFDDSVPRTMVSPVADLPETKDWREEGAVTEVKDQGQCGSCWAFSTTGTIEGAYFLKTGQLVSLSEQNLVDCTNTNAGCDGGWQYLAMNYVIENGGIDTEESYPYETRQDSCRYTAENSGAAVSTYRYITQGSEDDLYNAVGSIGPVAVSIDDAHDGFQFYTSGVYNEYNCAQNSPVHAVLVVGYGSTGGFDYWLVKNSWGASWGDKGYIKMARNADNMCGIANYGLYAIV